MNATRGEAYHTGYEARVQGESIDANPYPARSWDADEWAAGWDDAARETARRRDGREATMTTTHHIRITWIERGASDAACLGLDETVEIEADGAPLSAALRRARRDAEYHGECSGVDITKFEAHAELMPGSE